MSNNDSEELAATIVRIEEYSEDGSSSFLRNVGIYLSNYTLSIPEDSSLQ
jgi:hypothetical protein